jgi:putative toxin-antitoxin system antitoxin component (TIGR02293 family)
MGVPALAQLLADDDREAEIRSDLDWVKAVQSGLPVASVDTAIDELGFSPNEIDTLVLPRRTLAARRAKQQSLTRDESVRLARIARVALTAVETFGDSTKANRWLRRPNRALRNNTPLSLLDTDDGARLVEVVLGRIAYGLFS